MSTNSSKIDASSPTVHYTIGGSLFLFVVTIFFSIVVEVETVSSGIGRYVPIVGVQSVQSERPGTIVNIGVANGQHVLKGDVLLSLDPTDAATELASLEEQIGMLELESMRIEKLVSIVDSAETLESMSEFSFTIDDGYWGVKRHSSHISTEQTTLLESQLAELSAFQGEMKSRIAASQRLLEMTVENLKSANSLVLSNHERIAAARELFGKKIVSRMSFLDVEDSYNQSLETRRSYQKELEFKQASIVAIEAEYEKEFATRKRDWIKRSTEIGTNLVRLNQARIAATRRVENSDIRAPIDGIVEHLQPKTIGGVVQTGLELMQIVPSNQPMEVEALIRNTEVGFLKVGQNVNVKLHAFPPEIYGGITGELTSIAQNSIELDTGSWAYVVRIMPQQDRLEFRDQNLVIRPGMTVDIDIITGKRSIISYFFAPIVKVIQNSLGEQ